MNVVIDPSRDEISKRLLAFSCCSCSTVNSIRLSTSVPSTFVNGSYLLNLTEKKTPITFDDYQICVMKVST